MPQPKRARARAGDDSPPEIQTQYEVYEVTANAHHSWYRTPGDADRAVHDLNAQIAADPKSYLHASEPMRFDRREVELHA